MIDLNDSEILMLEKGPIAWLQKQQGTSKNLEMIRRTATQQFGEAGFQVNVLCYETDVDDCYWFEVEITGRVPGSRQFDPDKQTYEVVNNILNLPDQEGGWIKTDKKMLDDLAQGNHSGPAHNC